MRSARCFAVKSLELGRKPSQIIKTLADGMRLAVHHFDEGIKALASAVFVGVFDLIAIQKELFRSSKIVDGDELRHLAPPYERLLAD